jgi:hypothetical protein
MLGSLIWSPFTQYSANNRGVRARCHSNVVKSNYLKRKELYSILSYLTQSSEVAENKNI